MITTKYQGVPEVIKPEQIDDGIWIAKATEPGDTVSILGGVHGEERAGQRVVSNKVESGVEMVRGVLYLVHANLAAMKQGVHQIGLENMNRMFLREEPSQEAPLSETQERVEKVIKPVLDKSKAALDLHEAHSGIIPPFIICEPNAFDTAKAIGAKLISFGWSKTEPGGTDGYMYLGGAEGLCYELGFIKDHKNNVVLGEAAVARFLSVQGLTDEKLEPLFPDVPTRYIRTLQDFNRDEDGDNTIRFEEDYVTFDPLPKGKVIVWHGSRPIVADRDNLVALFPNSEAEPGQEILSFGEEVSPEAAMALQAAA